VPPQSLKVAFQKHSLAQAKTWRITDYFGNAAHKKPCQGQGARPQMELHRSPLLQVNAAAKAPGLYQPYRPGVAG
jgi:hypothetical protein